MLTTLLKPAEGPVLPEDSPLAAVRQLLSRMVTLCWVELRKIRHDRTEMYTRAIQPALWLIIFGETFTRIHAIAAPNGLPYLDYLAPGILAQSTLFIAIFYGIQIIWERDAGVLTKLMVTPTPRAALITGKAFASGVRSLVQAGLVIPASQSLPGDQRAALGPGRRAHAAATRPAMTPSASSHRLDGSPGRYRPVVHSTVGVVAAGQSRRALSHSTTPAVGPQERASRDHHARRGSAVAERGRAPTPFGSAWPMAST